MEMYVLCNLHYSCCSIAFKFNNMECSWNFPRNIKQYPSFEHSQKSYYTYVYNSLITASETRYCYIDDGNGMLTSSSTYATGDLVKIEGDNYYFGGRISSDFVKIGGHRVNLLLLNNVSLIWRLEGCDCTSVSNTLPLKSYLTFIELLNLIFINCEHSCSDHKCWFNLFGGVGQLPNN